MTYPIAALCLSQAILAVIIMYFLTQVPSLTPKWPWRHPFCHVMERIVSTGISMAWLGYMILMVYLSSALWLGEMDTDALLKMMEMGSVGLFIIFSLGTVILFHFAWLAWRADHDRYA